MAKEVVLGSALYCDGEFMVDDGIVDSFYIEQTLKDDFLRRTEHYYIMPDDATLEGY